ncbi:PREDICTED: pentatricopeptide repeat-containing protein At2g22410, mitochondrial-like [Ipomoea nil]|uniref:pentatricopeptide repeat-containing protein At2g22410, mitochondrial-like n=1 Tax=Ipomoea nil TaxID=35883 RepID=UPI000900F39D|nr:PREDICTED: pentatricopeptide repeat-containing protein At2g22410, mitochondrial-like [Ipomoea nil]
MLVYQLAGNSCKFESTGISMLSKPQALLRFYRSFSSNQKWNSNQQPNLVITHPTLLLIESCNSMSQLKQIQANMTRTGLIFHTFPVSRLLSFCALDDSGDIHYARLLFSQISEPNVYIWNTMIRGYVKAELQEMGLCVFGRMVRENIEMDERSYVFALKGCGVLGGFWVGESVHCRIRKVRFDEDLIVRNGLVHFYGQSGRVKDAKKVFDESPVRDVVSWTSLIDGYVRKNMADEALALFRMMSSSGVEPNEVTMIAVFSACAHKGDLMLGKFFHESMEKRGAKCGLNLLNAILDMYIKCGSLPLAKELFEKMEVKDAFSRTTMINGYAKNGEVDLARKCFSDMPHRNVVSWNAMIACYSQNNRPKEALELFHEMERRGLALMETTLVCVLSACAQSGSLDIGRRVHDYYVKQRRIKCSVILVNALIDMYAKCGSIDAAEELFAEMPERDLVSWNSLIVGCASHGFAGRALTLFEQMRTLGFIPDEITFVGVLSACAHAGLVNEGWKYLRAMEMFGLVPAKVHYACMIDLLSRVGQLRDAYELILSMPMEPDTAVWGALLNGCRMHGNVELGKLAGEKLIALDPEDSGIYVLLASLCANKRKWGDVSKLRSMMRIKGIKKNPGRSLIDVERKLHEFVAADESHPRSQAIYKVLNEIVLLSKLEEYQFAVLPVENIFQEPLHSDQVKQGNKDNKPLHIAIYA